MKSRPAMCVCLIALLAACAEDEGESPAADPAGGTDEAEDEEEAASAGPAAEDGEVDEEIAADEGAAGEDTDAEETAETQEPPQGRSPFPPVDCRGAEPDAEVTISSGALDPQTVEIGFGDLVRWENADEDFSPHRIVSDDHDRFDSGTMIEGNVHCLYFPSPGEYAYSLGGSEADEETGVVHVTAP